MVFKATYRHYQHVASELTLKGYQPQSRIHNTVLIPIGGLQRAVVEALRYAETLSDDVRAIYVDVNPVQTEQLRKDWAAWGGRVQLVVLPSPFRSLMEPLLEYIEQASAEKANDYVTVILPEFVPARWWQHLLHGQTSLLIRRCSSPEHRGHERAVPSLSETGRGRRARVLIVRSATAGLNEVKDRRSM